jgi:uncharacterized protein YaiL (DUF2058 family)
MSLRDQLIAAGLASKQQVKQITKPVRPPQVSRNKPAPVSAATLSAQRAQAEKFARDQALNRKQQEKAERQARRAQIRQLIEQSRLPPVGGDDYYNFVAAGRIRRIAVNGMLRDQILRGELLIASFGEQHDLVPASAAARIRERDPSVIIAIPSTDAAATANDAYKEFVVPDDLNW